MVRKGAPSSRKSRIGTLVMINGGSLAELLLRCERSTRRNSSGLSEPLPSNLVGKMGILAALPFCASGFSACACAPLFAVFVEVVGLG